MNNTAEEMFKAIVENLPVGIFTCDFEGKFLFGNQGAEEISGYSREELIGKCFWEVELFDLQDLEKANEILVRKKMGKTAEPTEFTLIRKDSRKRIVEVSTTIIQVAGRKIILGMVVDITDGKEKEEDRPMKSPLNRDRLTRSAAGLAGGIAHNFNNALVGVSGNVGLLERKLKENEDLYKYIKPLRASVQRMTGLTNQLLAFAGGGKYQPKTVAVRDIIETTLGLIKSNIDPGIRIETHLAPNTLYIEAEEAQVQMVFQAVLNNAGEAITGQGLIRIREKEVFYKEPMEVFEGQLRPGRYVCVTIEDNGIGMDKETRERIFEPFFTTRGRGWGRGMGMAAVYGITRDHGGGITVESGLGQGTRVSVYLPTVEAPLIKTEKTREGEIREVGEIQGTGTILLVDDEEENIQVTREILGKLGYGVLVAKNGKEAVETVQTYAGEIDLVMLDLHLSDGLGTEVYLLLERARPGLKVLVYSGFCGDDQVREILDSGVEGFVQKPFSIKSLAKKIKEIMCPPGKDGS